MTVCSWLPLKHQNGVQRGAQTGPSLRDKGTEEEHGTI